ncbi:aminotransferase class V-fold PLP-dependent enzyme [Arsenophonus sp. ENCA]|uniref:aminotransferase class V-fold PLP-dependent enzyme n=1 Tax=Arsenophonus sp. ENCA TaxID=1987579 RepID=UPI0025BA94CA|nr:aminotransferase class V-fold PLP-dependent enzyme [Arsenophonus sp. ENCA]
MVDGTQGIVHRGIDVQALDIDFFVFSAHKLYSPTGLGICIDLKLLPECWSSTLL